MRFRCKLLLWEGFEYIKSQYNVIWYRVYSEGFGLITYATQSIEAQHLYDHRQVNREGAKMRTERNCRGSVANPVAAVRAGSCFLDRRIR